MNDLADMLAQKANVSKREAQQFLSAFVESIQDGVNEEKLVKIKGLGTFKVIDVDARESVNVNTGERVTINSHQKLSFTPDAAMKELVNKPFSQFETVILNDGVEFEDEPEVDEPAIAEDNTQLNVIDEKSTEPIIEEKAESASEEEIVLNNDTSDSTTVKELTEELVEEDIPEAPLEEASLEEVPMEKTPIEGVPEVESESHSYWWLWLLLAIVACVICFAGGYILGRHVDHRSILDNELSVDTTTLVVPVVAKDSTIVTDTISKDTVTSNTIQAESVVEEKPVSEKKELEVEHEWQKYEKMDVRVRTGAYGIIGTDRMEKVRQGDTTKRIAKRTLGEGMECYIEVYNNVTSNELKEGQDIKIPKLKLKKFLRQNKTNN